MSDANASQTTGWNRLLDHVITGLRRERLGRDPEGRTIDHEEAPTSTSRRT